MNEAVNFYRRHYRNLFEKDFRIAQCFFFVCVMCGDREGYGTEIEVKRPLPITASSRGLFLVYIL